MSELAERMLPLYPGLNRDIVLFSLYHTLEADKPRPPAGSPRCSGSRVRTGGGGSCGAGMSGFAIGNSGGGRSGGISG